MQVQTLVKNIGFVALGEAVGRVREDASFFEDKKRKIDFVLCFTQSSSEDESVASMRVRFIANLRQRGMEIESDKNSAHGKDDDFQQFYKCHVPKTLLESYGEELNFRIPMKFGSSILTPMNGGEKGVITNWSDTICKKLKIHNLMYQDIPTPLQHKFACRFVASKADRYIARFHDESDQLSPFTDVQRSRIAYEILETTEYGDPKQGEVGINRLLSLGAFDAAYPLHEHLREDIDFQKVDLYDPESMNKREILREFWARWGVWYKYQPLDHVREYFGEKIALYFAWLGHYTSWLFVPSLVGLIVFLYGAATINSEHNRPAHDVCVAKEWEYKMCPLCEEDLGCVYWDLRHSCTLTKMSYLFDNVGTVFFAIFLSFWAVFFQEFWKRKEAFLAYHWDCQGYEEEAERPRPSFLASATDSRQNPVTGVEEPYFPSSKRHSRIISGSLIVLTMMSLVLIFMVGVIVYKLLIFRPLAQHSITQHYAFQVASLTGAVLNLICILILSRVYENLAVFLTDWEMHRTQTEYEDNLTFKVFVFQFVNFYASIFYIAFFKGKLVGAPGNYQTLLKLRQEECPPGGCLMELAQQLFIIMVGKQVIGNVQEMLIPMIKAYLNRRKSGVTETTDLPRWEEDYRNLVDNEGLFGEYLEMVIQFGFITIFVAAFPIAPLFALANNIFEIRIDSIKLVKDTRRPVAERAEDIGIWFHILSSIAQIAIVSNAFLIAFTSQFLPKLLYQYTVSFDGSLTGYLNYSLAWAPLNSTKQPCRYRDFRDTNGHYTRFYWHLLALKLGFVIVFEHVVFATHRIIDLLVPDVPEDLDIAIQRESFLAKRALADIVSESTNLQKNGTGTPRLPIS